MRERAIRRQTPHGRINIHPEENKLTVSFSEEDTREYSLDQIEMLQADIETLRVSVDEEMLVAREKVRNVQEIEIDLRMIYRHIPELRNRGQ